MASSEEPLYLTVGTDVSAKYRGAFCEAKIKKVQRMVKCRVTFKNNQGTHLVPDDHIRGVLRVGAHVEAKHPDKNQFLEAVIGKLLDYSQYTVVFDDGDETTLRRTSLCLKSGRHFAESETLDQLPLTNPEHFGTPVMGSKAKRKRRSATSASLPLEEESSEEETSALQQRGGGRGSGSPLAVVGRVVCLEGDRRKRDGWLPVLVVSPGQEGPPTGRDECLVRSFRDGKYFQVSKRHLRPFSRDGVPQRAESGALRGALERAQAYLDRGELPAHWDPQLLLRGAVKEEDEGDDDEEADDVSDDEPSEEKDRFVAQLYKFMDERGTPINKGPAINGRDLNLYRLFRLVGQLGGGNRVSNQNQWRRVYSRLSLPPPASQANAHLLRNSYKKYLQSFEDFYRKLGCTMESHPRGGASIRGGGAGRSPRHHRVLTRNQDRGLALFAPPVKEARKSREEVRKEKGSSELGLASSCGAQTLQTDQKSEQTRPRGTVSRDTPPLLTSAKRQWRRTKPDESVERADEDSSSGNGGDGGSGSSSTTGAQDGGSEGEGLGPRPSRGPLEVGVGDRVRVKYGRGRQLKVYEAKVLRIEEEGPDRRFYVHYTGWNMRYDEWVRKNRIVENVTDKAGRRKRMHKNAPDTPPGKRVGAARGIARRGRPPGTTRGSARPASTGSGGVRGRRRSGAMGYESGGVSDESSLQADATPREGDPLATSKEDAEEDGEEQLRSGTSSPRSPSPPQCLEGEASPTPDPSQEELGVKSDEKQKDEDEDEDTDIDETSAAPPRTVEEEEGGHPEGDDEEDLAEEETGGFKAEPEERKEEEEEEDSLSGNLLIYEESSTAEELDMERDEGSPEKTEALVPAEDVKEEETREEEEEKLEALDHGEGRAITEEAVQSADVEAGPEHVPEAKELATDFVGEVDIKEEPIVCEEVARESNLDTEAVFEAEPERGGEKTREEEGIEEVEPTSETVVEPTDCGASTEGPEPEVEELLYEEVDETGEMDGEATAKTVQELVESALEALDTAEDTGPDFADFAYAAEMQEEEEATREEEEEEPPAKESPKEKKSREEEGGHKKLKKRSKKLQCGAERKELCPAQGPFPKRRKVVPRRQALEREEEASGSGRMEQDGDREEEQDDFLSTLAEVCSGQESNFKEQPAAESADALFLLCEEKVPASPLHSAEELSAPIPEDTPPTTPDDSESPEASPRHGAPGGTSREAPVTATAAFLDAESTVSAEGDSENSRGPADLKCEAEDSSSSRTTDSADAVLSKAGGVKRAAATAPGPPPEGDDGARTVAASCLPLAQVAVGTKKARKTAAMRTPPRCDSGTTKARQPRSVLRTRDTFLGSSLENAESGSRRPSKFHFDAPLDKDMDPERRIAVLQERLAELRKVYMALKAEVALIDRRRKRAKKKDGGAPGMPEVRIQPETQCCS